MASKAFQSFPFLLALVFALVSTAGVVAPQIFRVPVLGFCEEEFRHGH